MRIWTRSILGFSLAICMSVPAFSVTSEQVLMESLLAQKAQNALDSLYGKNNFIVRASVSLSDPQYDVKYTRQSAVKSIPQATAKSSSEKMNILPGYPVIRNLAPPTQHLNQLPFDSVTRYTQPQVRKIVIDVIVNRDFPRGQAGRSTAVIKEVLGLSDGRDVVNMTYRPFARESALAPGGAPGSTSTTSQDIFSIQNILQFTALVLLVISLVIYILLKLKQFSLYKSNRASSDSSGGGSNVSVSPNIELPTSIGNMGGGQDITISNTPAIKVYFDFVTETNIDNLIFLLKKENIAIEHIAVIISFLPPQLASKVLGELDLKNQAVVTSTLLSQRLVNREFLDKLEARMRNWLECLVGGQSGFQRIFSFVSGEVKKQLLTVLGQNDPKSYEAFRSNILIFDDLRYLDDNELKFILSEVNIDLLATALVSVEEETYQRININLSKAAKEMIQQFLDLKGTAIAKQDIESAQDYILGIAGKLENEGKVHLREKITG
ncbi:MAG: hypothetical protein EXS67_03950 [Candidatus Margulisbacteria bacterium]|nr:hypothetical protein [Candidatus Margulisiibacteriota bacterium]